MFELSVSKKEDLKCLEDLPEDVDSVYIQYCNYSEIPLLTSRIYSLTIEDYISDDPPVFAEGLCSLTLVSCTVGCQVAEWDLPSTLEYLRIEGTTFGSGHVIDLRGTGLMNVSIIDLNVRERDIYLSEGLLSLTLRKLGSDFTSLPHLPMSLERLEISEVCGLTDFTAATGKPIIDLLTDTMTQFDVYFPYLEILCLKDVHHDGGGLPLEISLPRLRFIDVLDSSFAVPIELDTPMLEGVYINGTESLSLGGSFAKTLTYMLTDNVEVDSIESLLFAHEWPSLDTLSISTTGASQRPVELPRLPMLESLELEHPAVSNGQSVETYEQYMNAWA